MESAVLRISSPTLISALCFAVTAARTETIRIPAAANAIFCLFMGFFKMPIDGLPVFRMVSYAGRTFTFQVDFHNIGIMII